MNQTQVNDFLKCLLQIDDLNYLALHERAAVHSHASNNNNAAVAHSNNNYNSYNTDYHNGNNNNINGTIRAALAAVAAAASAQPRLDDHDDHDHDHDHDHEHDHEHSDSHDLLVAKVTAMVVLFVASTLCGSIPFLLNRCFRWTESSTNARSAVVVKCLLYFGGGVLLCTTFLHLLPEVREAVESLQECGSIPKMQFALAELLMCGGFFLMYLVEESIHAYIHRHKRIFEATDEGAGAAFERGHSVRNSYLVRGQKKEQEASHAEHNSQQTLADKFVVVGGEQTPPATPATPSTLSVQDLISHEAGGNWKESNNGHTHHHHSHHHHNHHEPGHSHLPTNLASADDMMASSLRGFLIVLALSLHELFEGMAIGLEMSAGSVWFMFGAVSAHKLVLAFCVGVELIVARTRLALSIVYVLTFAVVSPLGIGIGILISNTDESSVAPSIPSAILQGMACGTLLYVVFFEILSKNHSGLLAYVSLIVGFVVMFGLQQLTTDGHGHSHGSCGSTATDQHLENAKNYFLQEHTSHNHGGGGHGHDHGHDHEAHRTTTEHHHEHHHHGHEEHTTMPAASSSEGGFEKQLQQLRQISQNLFGAANAESDKKMN